MNDRKVGDFVCCPKIDYVRGVIVAIINQHTVAVKWDNGLTDHCDLIHLIPFDPDRRRYAK